MKKDFPLGGLHVSLLAAALALSVFFTLQASARPDEPGQEKAPARATRAEEAKVVAATWVQALYRTGAGVEAWLEGLSPLCSGVLAGELAALTGDAEQISAPAYLTRMRALAAEGREWPIDIRVEAASGGGDSWRLTVSARERHPEGAYTSYYDLALEDGGEGLKVTSAISQETSL